MTLPFLILVLLTLGVLGLSPRRPDLTDVVLTLAFLSLGLYAERNLPISGMGLGFIAVKYAPDAARAAFHKDDRPPTTQVPLFVAVAVILVLAVTFGAVVLHRFPKSGSLTAVADQSFPIGTIASLPDAGVRLFSDDRWAALAIYMKWPGTHVAFDGRGDLYGKQIIAKYEATIDGRPDWENWLNQICANYVLTQERGGLANVIESSADWRTLRKDPIAGGQAVLLSRIRPAGGCSP
jgi:hypothetical protein